jgi:PKD repeat protein
LSKPGKYTIQVSRGAEEGVNATVKSNTVTVTVTPAAK